MGLNIVLVEPEIPHNTGSIARTCALTNTCLHLVKPLGFSVEDKYLKRAGLDYWDLVEIYYYDSFSEILDKYPKNDFYYASTKSKKYYTEFN
ncbi:MAG TPA: TrmH family RNA methyltransferase, partial [Tissierellaceae bacterium]|nr:TrmH family RNA methyltransferase [Tissierellaceae bacterium]